MRSAASACVTPAAMRAARIAEGMGGPEMLRGFGVCRAFFAASMRPGRPVETLARIAWLVHRAGVEVLMMPPAECAYEMVERVDRQRQRPAVVRSLRFASRVQVVGDEPEPPGHRPIRLRLHGTGRELRHSADLHEIAACSPESHRDPRSGHPPIARGVERILRGSERVGGPAKRATRNCIIHREFIGAVEQMIVSSVAVADVGINSRKHFSLLLRLLTAGRCMAVIDHVHHDTLNECISNGHPTNGILRSNAAVKAPTGVREADVGRSP